MNKPLGTSTAPRPTAMPPGSINRRGFLGTTAGALATVSLVKAAEPAASEPSLLLYADRQSYLPGEKLTLFVSTTAKTYDVAIERIAAKREVVWSKQSLPGRDQPTPDNASAQGCRWTPTGEVTIAADWPTGFYVLKANIKSEFRDNKPNSPSEHYFVVRSATPGSRSKILLQLSTNTDNAYNNFAGYSLYAFNGRDGVQGRRVSWDRPMPGEMHRNWELPFIEWCEKNGYPLEYAVNNDLEFHPNICDPYKVVLSVGHDEYWSAPMRDTIEQFAARGGNVAFFSGNVCCWQVRNEDNGLTCYKDFYREDPKYRPDGPNSTLSTLWSHYLIARPENRLTGVGVLSGGFHRSHGQLMDASGALTVERPDHWVFAGTNLARNQEFGGDHTIAGYECDGCDFTRDANGLPVPTFKDGSPQSLEILATAPAQWGPEATLEWYEHWPQQQRGHACLCLYRTAGGGTVFTAGTTDWSHGLKGTENPVRPADAIVEQITRNVLDRLGA